MSCIIHELVVFFSSDGDHVVPKEDPVALEAKEFLMEWRKTLFKYFAVSSTDEQYNTKTDGPMCE